MRAEIVSFLSARGAEGAKKYSLGGAFTNDRTEDAGKSGRTQFEARVLRGCRTMRKSLVEKIRCGNGLERTIL